MRIAIAGSGDLTRYFCEEFTLAGHTITILARSEKPYLNLPGVTQKITDYSSIDSIKNAIGNSEVLVSTILDYTMTFFDVHKTLIEACKLSPSCKRFIPAEYGGNIEDYPDQPGFYFDNHEPIRQILREQNDLEWTLISTGWLIDYVIPTSNRYMKDIGPAFPINLADKQIIIPGRGNEPVNVIATRDMAKAVAVLLSASAWEPYTYISGEQTNWQNVAAAVQEHYGEFNVEYKTLTQLVNEIVGAKDEMTRFVAEYQLFSISGAGSFDQEKVLAHREKYFKGIHFRTVAEVLKQAAKYPAVVV